MNCMPTLCRHRAASDSRRPDRPFGRQDLIGWANVEQGKTSASTPLLRTRPGLLCRAAAIDVLNEILDNRGASVDVLSVLSNEFITCLRQGHGDGFAIRFS